MAEKKEYVPSEKVLAAERAVEEMRGQKPGDYVSAYDSQMKALMEQILNRETFRYNVNGDALYRQYRDGAIKNGRLAMADTMGQAAALTGGYGNSYAQSVGQQAYQRSLDSLGDRIPELYALALEQYRQQSQGLQQKYDLLAGADRTGYSRWQDSLAAWQKEADALAAQYRDTRDFDYQAFRDGVKDDQWLWDFQENKRRYDQQWDYDHQPAPEPAPVVVYSGPSTAKTAEKKKDTVVTKTQTAVKPGSAVKAISEAVKAAKTVKK